MLVVAVVTVPIVVARCGGRIQVATSVAAVASLVINKMYWMLLNIGILLSSYF